jgi:hypothetical protein
MTSEPTVRSRLREIAEGPFRDLPTPEESLKAEARAKVNREKAAKGRAGQLRRSWVFGRNANGQRTALRAVPGDREPPDDDPSGAA